MTKTEYLVTVIDDYGKNNGKVYLMSERYRPDDYEDINDFIRDVCSEYQNLTGNAGFNILIELNQLAFENDKRALTTEVSYYNKLYKLDYDYNNRRFSGDYTELQHQESNIENDDYDEADVDDSDRW